MGSLWFTCIFLCVVECLWSPWLRIKDFLCINIYTKDISRSTLSIKFKNRLFIYIDHLHLYTCVSCYCSFTSFLSGSLSSSHFRLMTSTLSTWYFYTCRSWSDCPYSSYVKHVILPLSCLDLIQVSFFFIFNS